MTDHALPNSLYLTKKPMFFDRKRLSERIKLYVLPAKAPLRRRDAVSAIY
jgi:hypothetical protein